MVELSMDGDLTEFDLAHFCDGNPVYCYYFRLPSLQAMKRPDKPENPLQPEPRKIKLPRPLDGELSLEIGEDIQLE